MATTKTTLTVRKSTGIIFLLPFMILFPDAFSQTSSTGWMWARSVTASNVYTYERDATVCDASGNAVLLSSKVYGGTNNGIVADSGKYIAKYDVNGALKWSLHFSEKLNRLACDENDNIYCVGKFLTNIALIKLSPAGSVIWKKLYPGGTYSNANDIAISESGNLFVCGRFTDYLTIGNVTVQDTQSLFVAKLDANGGALWIKTGSDFFNPAKPHVNNGVGTNICVDKNEFVYLNYASADIPCEWYCDSHSVARLNSNGTVLNINLYGDIRMWGNGICVDDSGNVFLTHGKGIWTSGGSYMLTKFSNDLQTIRWSTTIGEWEGGKKIMDSKPVLDPQNNIYVAGFAGGQEIDWDSIVVGNQTLALHGKGDVIVAKINNATGNYMNCTVAGGSFRDGAADIAFNKTGTCYVTGFFGRESHNDTICFDNHCLNDTSQAGDLFIARLNTGLDITSLTENIAKNNFNLYPNPTEGKLTLEFGSFSHYTIKLISSSGEKVRETIFDASNADIDLHGLSDGLYFIIAHSKGIDWSKKVLVKSGR
jgi:hypothetical protein